MTKVKLDSKIGGGAAAAIEPYTPALYARPGMRVVGVFELTHVERVQPAPDSDGEPSVKIRISAMELATRDQEGAVRDAMRALHLQRTAQGTLTEDGEVELSKGTIERTAGVVSDLEVARLRAGLTQWAANARQVAGTDKQLSASEFRREMRTIADGLAVLLDRSAALFD
jgi:hypothetical protein